MLGTRFALRKSCVASSTVLWSVFFLGQNADAAPKQGVPVPPPKVSLFFGVSSDGDWYETVSLSHPEVVRPLSPEHTPRALFAGGELEIVVSPTRRWGCGRQRRLYAYISLAGDEPIEVPIDDFRIPHDTGSFTIPEDAAPGSVAIWLKAEDDTGCVAWDSDYNANYRFPMLQWRATRLRFTTDWQEIVYGSLLAGGFALVEYDTDRLSSCSYHSYRYGDLTDHQMWARYDTGAERVHSVGSGPQLVPIPEDARSVEIWFRTEIGMLEPDPCRAWDSNYGQNYHFVLRTPN